jgi:hypothetical protein
MAARGDNPLAADGENAMTVDKPTQPRRQGRLLDRLGVLHVPLRRDRYQP